MDFDVVSSRVKANISEISNSLKTLQDTTLLYWPKSQNDNNAQLIESEYQEHHEGYKARIILLQQFQDEANQLEAIQHGYHDPMDPFRPYRESYDEAIASGKDVTNVNSLREIFAKMLRFLGITK